MKTNKEKDELTLIIVNKRHSNPANWYNISNNGKSNDANNFYDNTV